MEAAMPKRPKIPKETHKNHEEKCDPLMSLPEPLLHHILSCLAMKDVIRTSVLSKRWRYMRLYVPCLMFSPSKMSRSKEVAFINQSLLLHKGPAIQKFSLTFLQHDAETHHVNSWIYFAKTRNVNKLNLDFRNNHPETPSVCCYRLPNFLFSSTSLTALSLVRCEIHFPVNCKLSSLKILSLEQVDFSSGAVDDLTDATPFLESLSLTNCQRFADLPIYMFFGSTMTTLKIHESDQVSSSSMLSIAGDYIASFELVTSMSRKYYFIRRMKSLESASLACNEVNCGLYKADKEKIIFEILDNVRHVKYLRLCSCYIHALCNHEEKILNCLSFDVSCVAMKTGLMKRKLPGIGYMLRHSPNIKTLIINIDKIQAKKCNEKLEEGEYWKLQEPNFVDLLCNLKDVKIYNFQKNLEDGCGYAFGAQRLSVWQSWSCCDRFSVELDVGPLQCQGASQDMEETMLKRRNILKKTQKNGEEKCDPLKSLPEPLLHHILSYLTMKDVIRTSILSKRWRYIWFYVPCLKFSPLKMSRSKEVAFINQSLLLHKGPAIQKFSLTFLQPDAEPHHIDSWIYFAKTRNINELNLDFRNNHPETPSVYFSGGAIADLTNSTPILESISLKNCQRFANFHVYMFYGSMMKTLKIQEDQVSSSSTLAIAGHSIASFELVTSMSREYYFISRVKSLESASLRCNEVNCGQYKADKEKTVFEILVNVRHVKYLRLCSCYIQALCRDKEQSLNCLSFEASCLAIKTGLTKGELPGIGYMLRHSPNIKTLIINIDKIQAKESHNHSEDGEYWKVQEPNFVDLLCNLKDVKIYNFLKNLEVPESKQLSTTEDFLADLQNDMNFLRFLLNNCKVMERMTITTFKDVQFGRNSENKKLKLLFQVTQELLAFSRASRAVQISFN
ncbi:hypothetical protein Vadar_019985 [Vaccinium darrowii]|uniref:Uncharacterized protein n=1 Tax=Vaccinium darrowii TaxID=229202 RepID=A0ACB7Z608_9ERIC|nr:hypothetical protein Vadar_019985 [Vaccinium darrowii]